jgi:hypothetical protein
VSQLILQTKNESEIGYYSGILKRSVFWWGTLSLSLRQNWPTVCILANPTASYPHLFGSLWLFTCFPYLLPCLVSAFISFVCLVTGFFFLKETLKKENTKMQENDEDQKESLISESD